MKARNQSASRTSQIEGRLRAAISQIEQVKDVAKTPSISFGVLVKGKIIFADSIGLRDVQHNQYANSDTAYLIGSCSKIFTSAAVGTLVDKGTLSWHDTIQKHIPSFDPVEDPDIGKYANIIDVCRHSTGLANPNVVFMGPQGAPAIKTENYIDMINALPASNEEGPRFNSWWFYSNAAYGLLAFVVKAVAGMEFSTFLRYRICNPLGLNHTLLTEDDVAANTNLAHPYVQKDGKWHKIENGLTSKEHSHTLAVLGMRSSVNDLLRFCGAVMDRYATEQRGTSWYHRFHGWVCGFLRTPEENPLREISSIWDWCWTRPHKDGFNNDTAYTLGWIRTTMPTSALSLFSYNSVQRDKYIIGRKSPPRKVYGHSGCVNGSVATVYVIPESEVAVVALSNAADVGDASNTTAQILLQAVFDLSPKVDLILPLKESRDARLKMHRDMINDWNRRRNVTKYKCHPDELVGTYHGLGASIIEIVKSENPSSGLAVVFGGQKRSRCELDPFNRDSLSFLPMDHEEILARAMIDWDYWTVGVFRFVRADEHQEDSPIVGLRWKWEEYEESTLWVKMHKGMSQSEYDAVVETHGKFLKDPWSDTITSCKGNGNFIDNSNEKNGDCIASKLPNSTTKAG